MAEIVNIFNIGDFVPIKDTQIGVDKTIRIKSFTRNLLRPYSYNIELSDIVEVSILQRLIANNIETAKVLSLNKLTDVARAKRNWKSTRELLDMIFDQDGYFDGGNIKPESIETMMLSVGARSQQLTLNCTIAPNYGGDSQVVNVSAGTLSHYAIEDTIRDWNIAAAETTLTDTGAYYIYARCSVSGSTGSIVFSQSQIKVNDEPEYYNFLLGVLHAVSEEVRWVSLTFGATTINGKYIKTGCISSMDGTTWFDLESGRLEVGSATLGTGQAGISGLVSASPETDVRFWAGSSYANRANAPFRVLNNGSLIAKGCVELGTMPDTRYMSLALKDNDIYEPNWEGDGSSVVINRQGYNNLFDYFRDFIVMNGKGENLLHIIGSEGALYFNGPKVQLGMDKKIATGSTNIICSGTEADMANMSVSVTPKSNRLFIMFSAPFAVTTNNQTLNLYINIAGVNVRKQQMTIHSYSQGASFQHLANVTPGTTYTVKMRWSGTSYIEQRGSTDSERILTVLDLP